MSIKQLFQICLPVKLADERMSVKKQQKISAHDLQHFQFGLEKRFHEDKLNMTLRLSIYKT